MANLDADGDGQVTAWDIAQEALSNPTIWDMVVNVAGTWYTKDQAKKAGVYGVNASQDESNAKVAQQQRAEAEFTMAREDSNLRYDEQQRGLESYKRSGDEALGRLDSRLEQGINMGVDAPSLTDIQDAPWMAGSLKYAQQAKDRRYAAQGKQRSGATNLADYSEVAQPLYQQTYNTLYRDRMNRLNTYLDTNMSQIRGGMSAQNASANITGARNTLNTGIAQNLAGVYGNIGSAQGQGITGSAAARQASNEAQANAMQQGGSNFAQNLASYGGAANNLYNMYQNYSSSAAPAVPTNLSVTTSDGGTFGNTGGFMDSVSSGWDSFSDWGSDIGSSVASWFN